MYSHEELISAVRAAGRDGKTFTTKELRAQLGFETRDKKEISRFRRRMRAFEKAASDELEKVGNNSYRLRTGAFEQNAALDITPPVAAEVDLEPATGVFEAARPANQTVSAIVEKVELQAVRDAADVQPLATAPQPAAVEPSPQQPAAAVVEPVPQRVAAAAVESVPQQAAAAIASVPQPAAAATVIHLATQPTAAQPTAAQPTAAAAAQPVAAAYVAPAVVSSVPQPVAETAPAAAPHKASVPERALSAASAMVSNALAASAAVSGKVRERGRELRDRGLKLRERGEHLREQLWSCLQAVPLNRHAVARLRGWAEGLRPLSNEVREHLHALRQRVSSIRRRAA